MSGRSLWTVLERILRLVAITTSLLVVGGWGLFAIDESRAASEQSAAESAGLAAVRVPDPTAAQERAREKLHGGPRELVDDANDILLAPFAPLVDGSHSEWIRRTAPALAALLVYGFGLGFLARLSRGVV
jgi:hypothetical protein